MFGGILPSSAAKRFSAAMVAIFVLVSLVALAV